MQICIPNVRTRQTIRITFQLKMHCCKDHSCVKKLQVDYCIIPLFRYDIELRCVCYNIVLFILLYCMWFRYTDSDAVLTALSHILYVIDISSNMYDSKCQAVDFSEINKMWGSGYKS